MLILCQYLQETGHRCPPRCAYLCPLGFKSLGSASSGAEASGTCEVCWEDQRKAHGQPGDADDADDA